MHSKNIDFFINHLEANAPKKAKREIVYGRFIKRGKIDITCGSEKISLEDWAKDIKFKKNQRLRITIEVIGKAGI